MIATPALRDIIYLVMQRPKFVRYERTEVVVLADHTSGLYERHLHQLIENAAPRRERSSAQLRQVYLCVGSNHTSGKWTG